MKTAALADYKNIKVDDGGCVYVLRNLVNGKCYVGSTFRFGQRMSSYKGLRCNHQVCLLGALKKHGIKSFQIEIAAEGIVDDEMLNGLEIGWTLRLNALAPDGYVLKAGNRRGQVSDSTKKKIGAASSGRKHTDESRAKLSAAHMGKKLTDKTRAKISAARKGIIFTDETRAKLSEANKGRKLTDETRAKLSAAHMGKKLTDKTRAKISAGRKGIIFTDEHKEKLSAAGKKYWARQRKQKQLQAGSSLF